MKTCVKCKRYLEDIPLSIENSYFIINGDNVLCFRCVDILFEIAHTPEHSKLLNNKLESFDKIKEI